VTIAVSLFGISVSRIFVFLVRYGIVFLVGEADYAAATIFFLVISAHKLLSEYSTQIILLRSSIREISHVANKLRNSLIFITFGSSITSICISPFILDEGFPFSFILIPVLVILFSLNPILFTENQKKKDYRNIALSEVASTFIAGCIALSLVALNLNLLFVLSVYFILVELIRFSILKRHGRLLLYIYKSKEKTQKSNINNAGHQKLLELFLPKLLNYLRMHSDKLVLSYLIGPFALAKYYFYQGIAEQIRTQLFAAVDRVVGANYHQSKTNGFTLYFSKATQVLFLLFSFALLVLKGSLSYLAYALPLWLQDYAILEVFLLGLIPFCLFGFSSEILQLDGHGYWLSCITFCNLVCFALAIYFLGGNITVHLVAVLSVASIWLQRSSTFLALLHKRGINDVVGDSVMKWVLYTLLKVAILSAISML
jgi:O-antigen/teichoic acid export membrane protein